jgi:hypothetical protein
MLYSVREHRGNNGENIICETALFLDTSFISQIVNEGTGDFNQWHIRQSGQPLKDKIVVTSGSWL